MNKIAICPYCNISTDGRHRWNCPNDEDTKSPIERKSMKKEKPPKCLNCGKLMKPVKDKIAGKYTGYLWRCSCMPKGQVLSKG